ncbi:RnfH family protein [Pseudomonas sp. NPDC089734]|uniref:RnfH family protein n=1 Tax=Pseudomonas sp. NPDC089734 TaxID=3364469 RepID=UPI0038308D23
MSDVLIRVEVVYAAADRQLLLAIDVPTGSSVQQALAASGIQNHFPELDLQQCPVGIFGKAVKDPSVRVLEAGDRIEIYRPLLADPMEVRRLRAAKARLNRNDGR